MTVDLDPILNARRGTAGAAEATTVPPGEAKCSWCGQDFQLRRGGSPQRFCSTEHRTLFWSTLRRWGERAVAAGILTLADIRNGDPAACTLPEAPVSPPPVPAQEEEFKSDDFGRLLDKMDGILGEPTIALLIRLRWLAGDQQKDHAAVVHALCRFSRTCSTWRATSALELVRRHRLPGVRAGHPRELACTKRGYVVFSLSMSKKFPEFSRLFWRSVRPQPGLHPAMRARMWKPGQSGNPAGVSKAYAEAMREMSMRSRELSLGAERTRRWRQKRRQGVVVVSFDVAPDLAGKLILLGWLPEADRGGKKRSPRR